VEDNRLRLLIDTRDPAWPLVSQWIKGARNHVQVLSTERLMAKQVLLALQVTTRSPMGAIAYETGGILIDHGWMTILGAGTPTFAGNLLSWNSPTGTPSFTPASGMLLIAYDVVGGFFALNGGALSESKGSVYYLAPDTLNWELVADSYSAFLRWALAGDLEAFYASFRWKGWEQEVGILQPNQGILIYPPLWAKGASIAERARRSVPMHELWGLNTGGWQVYGK
jgi:hypothetical protein